MQSLRFTVRHLRWVPHFLTGQQKRTSADTVSDLLRVSSSQMTRQWHDIVTVDDLWVYLCTEHEIT
jgi:hypothetical protein